MIKNYSTVVLFVGGGGGSLISFFLMEETGRVKTNLGECNLKVTRHLGECSKILQVVTENLYKCQFQAALGYRKHYAAHDCTVLVPNGCYHANLTEKLHL